MLHVASFDNYHEMPNAGLSSAAYKLVLPAYDEPPQLARKQISGDHQFGDGKWDWMPALVQVYEQKKFQPNATFHVSAIKPEIKPDVVAYKSATSKSGDGDVTAAPKAKGVGGKAAGKTKLAAMVSALAPKRPDGRGSLWEMGFDGSGCGGQFKPLDF